MATTGPIVIIKDDAEDREVFEEILRELGVPNKSVWFTKCEEAFNYLLTTTDQPFLIFSDVNLPKQNGIEIKRAIDNDERLRKRLPCTNREVSGATFLRPESRRDCVRSCGIKKSLSLRAALACSGPPGIRLSPGTQTLASGFHPGIPG